MTAPHPCTARCGNDLRVLRAAVFAAVCVVLAAAGHTLASCATVPLWTLGAGFLGIVLVVAPFAGRARSLPGIAALLALGQTVLHTLFGLGQQGTAAMAPGATSRGSMGSTGPMHSGGSGSLSSMSDAALVEQAARLVCGTAAAAISPARAYRLLVEARVHPGTGAGHGSLHHAADALSASPGSPVSLLPSLPMLLGHVLAALAAGWLLRRGDLALLRLLELSARSAHSLAEGALVRSLRGALALVCVLRAGLPGGLRPGPRLPRTALLAPTRLRTTALQHTVIRRGPPSAAALDLAA
ncbi:hypothetical protein GR925_20135 [Streptomyces sp. HUCO-GS316]|uniref:hypothetical protein n=1 Tax=Streptomyces sp. HUCO-GS316 TaxID=2692198 RepID=UPI00136C3CDA|nr:hypothetical protein [Streptomyces sp. HUCO-GS316]MXM65698.1 hypothetical protein [Streptomyces sp. HUCO-GS316]